MFPSSLYITLFSFSATTAVQCLAWLYVCLGKVQVFVTQLRKGWMVEEPGEVSAALQRSLSSAGPTLCMKLENAVKKSTVHRPELCVLTQPKTVSLWLERAWFQWELHTRLNPRSGRPIGHGRLQCEGEQ